MKKVLMATGASGGHVFPALAIAQELKNDGIKCVFVLGGGRFQTMLEKEGFATEVLPAAPWNVSNPLRKIWALITLFQAVVKAVLLIQKHHPSAVCGTGGFASVALVLAGKTLGVPSLVQDQNTLPGRANKLLARWVDKVALSYDVSRQYFSNFAHKLVVCGNPVRREIIESQSRKRSKEEPFNVLVLGGSLGARILSDVMPNAFEEMGEGRLTQISITHQARPEDVERVMAAYKRLGFAHVEVKAFFNDIAERMIDAHLIVSRSGASAVSECALLARASILVPHRLADNHQLHNARVLSDRQGAKLLEEPAFTPKNVAEAIRELMDDPSKRENMEQQARKMAQPNAAKNVAQQVRILADNDVMQLKNIEEKQAE